MMIHPTDRNSGVRGGSEVRMSDGLPGHTCPAIDEVKRLVRKNISSIRDRDRCFELLEELRGDNLRLREGYARAMKQAKKQA